MAEVLIWAAGALKQPGDLVRPTNSGVVTQPPLDNASMDDGSSGWSFSGLGSHTIDTDPPVFDGTYSMKLGWTDNPNGEALSVLNDELLPVTPGQLVTLRMYVQSEVTGDFARIMPGIYWYGPSGLAQPLAPTTYPLDPTIVDGEARVNSSGLSSAAANLVWVLLEFSGVAPAGAAFWTAGMVAHWGDCHWTVDKVSYSYAFTEEPNNLIFRATQAAAGFTGSTEPDWPTSIGLTVVDNDVTWEAVSGNSVTWQASRILVSGDTEPVWPLAVNGAVADGTITWTLNSRRVTDSHVPNDSEVVLIASSKVFVGDKDIVDFSATVNPLDWSTKDDAGFIAYGLQQYGGKNPIRALGLYRGNMAIFNTEGCQLWQLDEDPAGITYLDAIPVSCNYPKSVQPVGDDLAFLSNLGIRSLGMSGAAVNLQGGFFGQQVDPLVLPALAQLTLEDGTPIGLYWPARGQYWLFFGVQAFVLTITGGQNEKKQRSWSRYVFPWVITDWTIQGIDLVLRAGELIEVIDPDALLDDEHDQTLTYIELERAVQYATEGWALADSSIDVGETQNHEDGVPVHIVGPPLSLPILFVTASSTQVGSLDQSIIASYDNGASWTPITMPAGGIGICGCAHSPSRREILFLQPNGQILKSVDGTTVASITSDLNTISTTLQDLCRNADDTLYIACGDSGVIATSPDGLTWTQRSAPNVNYRKFLVANDGHVLCGSSANTGTPISISADGGVTWAANSAFGFNSTVYELAESATGRYEFGTRDNNFTIATADLASFAQIAGLTSQTALCYAPAPVDLFVACSGPADTVGIYSSPGNAAQAWTARTSGLGADYKNVEDIIPTFTGGVIGIRPAGSGVALPTIVRSPTVIGNWSKTTPAQFNANAVYARIYEISFDELATPVNTATFEDRTITGDAGDTTVTVSGPVIGNAGNRVFIKYAAEGPFTVEDGNDVASRQITLSAGVEKYFAQFSALRITRVGGVDFNYLREAVEPGATILPLLFPLEHSAIEVTAFPVGTLVLNDVDETIGYIALELQTSVLGATELELAAPLPVDADALPFIIRPYQLTAVAGGQGTSDLELEDDTTFANEAEFIPEAGFPAAPVIVGDFIVYATGEEFIGVIQWPFIDMKNPGADKEMTGFDLVINGDCDVSVGYNQKELDYDLAKSWTEPFRVFGDTLPGQPVPYSVTGPTLSLRLEFSANQAWEWFAANLYIKDLNV